MFWLQYKTNVNLLNVFRHRQQQQQEYQDQKKVIKTEVTDNTRFDDVIRQRLGSLKPLDFSSQRRGGSEDDGDTVPDTSTPLLGPQPAHPAHLAETGGGGGGGTEERRRQRNREASRRYRERARTNPDLLRRMREQQNARQKKYYARLRQRKQSSASSLVRIRNRLAIA